MNTIGHLIQVAQAYAAHERVELSTVSWRVFGDTKKLAALQNGSDIQVRRFEAAMAWFSENWPPAAEWPDAVPRRSKIRVDHAEATP